MTRLSLFGRYWASLAILATLPILAAGLVEGWAVYSSDYKTAIGRQTLEARQAAYLIERSVLPPLDRLRIIVGVPWDYETATSDEYMAEIRRLLRQFPLIGRVQRVDANGQVLGFLSRDGLKRQLEGEERRELLEWRGSRGRVAGESLLVRREGRASWALALIERGTGNLLVADLRTDVVNDLVADTAQHGGNLVFVVDKHGTILAHPEIPLVHAGTTLSSLRGWESILGAIDKLNNQGPIEGTLGEIVAQVSAKPQSNDEWIAGYRRIKELDWIVFALAPSASLRTQLREAVVRTSLVLITANAIALLLALFLARQLSRPIALLVNASQRVTQGDLAARAEVMSDDDIGQLARQFNAMVAELQQSYGKLEEKVAEKTAALELANRHKSEFLAQMSHELRTPLNAVIGFSDALKAQYFGPLNAKQEEYVRNILASGRHLLALINDLLDLAKIEAGRMDLAPSQVDVPALVSASLTLVQGRAADQGVALRERIADHVGFWVADERKLKQILLNLLSNAIKFTPSGGSVELAAERIESASAGTPAVLRFSISDTGIGIPPDQVSRLFTDFGQLRHSDGTPREGTGLGLALTRRLVRLHGGEIEVTSEPARGSTFSFTLPERTWPAA